MAITQKTHTQQPKKINLCTSGLLKICTVGLFFSSLFGAAHGANALTCSTSANTWSTGYVLNVTVKNDSTNAISGWNVKLNHNQNSSISGSWSAILSASGNTVNASNITWNGTLSAGQSTSFGYQGTHNGNFELPSCNAGSEALPTPTPLPTPITTPVATPTQAPTPIPTPTATPTPTSIPTQTPTSPPINTNEVVIQENAIGFCSVEGSIDSNNAGYTGAGFANTDNASNRTVTWLVNAEFGGSYQLEWRFANGSSADRTASVLINGTSQSEIDFSTTGSWTSWTTDGTAVNLASGINKIVLAANTDAGLSNIDSLTLQGNGIEALNCATIATPTPEITPTSIPTAEPTAPPSNGTTPDCNDMSGVPTITVAKSGGQYSTVKSAIESISTSNSQQKIIKIAPGTYKEKIVVDRPNITFCGQKGKEASTIITYNDYGGNVGTSESYSMLIKANDVSGENITIENSYGPGSQAVALRVTSERVQFRNCRLIGYQDTVYNHGGSQYFRNCYITGNTDYIFGAATAVFQDSTMHNLQSGTAVTAPSTAQGDYGIIFIGGKLTAESSVGNEKVHLGRNWRPYGNTVYIGVELGAHIRKAGWVAMGSNSLSTARFYEYKSTGPGANPSARVSESKQLSDSEAAQYTIEKIYGDWIPTYSK